MLAAPATDASNFPKPCKVLSNDFAYISSSSFLLIFKMRITEWRILEVFNKLLNKVSNGSKTMEGRDCNILIYHQHLNLEIYERILQISVP